MERQVFDPFTNPVRTVPCEHCHFSDHPRYTSAEEYHRFVATLMRSSAWASCQEHHEQVVCRSGRDIQIRWLYATGELLEATDAAFEEYARQLTADS